MNPSEDVISGLLDSQGVDVFRHGWPDFLIQSHGITAGVEVKGPNDFLRPRQKLMHDALARVMPVYVVRVSGEAEDGSRLLGGDWRDLADRLDLQTTRIRSRGTEIEESLRNELEMELVREWEATL